MANEEPKNVSSEEKSTDITSAEDGAAGASDEEKDWKSEYEKAMAEVEKVTAQSRKWEARSKANAEKAKKFDAAQFEQMSEQEKYESAEKRAAEAEAELARYKHQEEKNAWVKSVSEKTNVPADVLSMFDAESEEELSKKADAIAKHFSKNSAPYIASDGHGANVANAHESGNDWLRSTLKRH